MREHKTLENMVEVAENRGESMRKGWTVTMERESLNKTIDLGYKKVEEVKDVYTFIHWGTPILQIKQEGNLYSRYVTSYRILHGESKSDSDAINAMLRYFGITNVQTTFRPVNGGFIVIKDDKEQPLYKR